MMSYSKASVQTHSDFGQVSNPAVNIKAHLWEHGDSEHASFRDDLLRSVADDVGYDADHFVAWWRSKADEEGQHGMSALDDLLSVFGSLDCEDQFEWARELASEIFGGKPGVWQEGRSGGWMVVHDLLDLDYWDAVMLGKWRKFETYVKRSLAEHAERVAVLIAINTYDAEISEIERKKKAAAEHEAAMAAMEQKWSELV